MAISTSPNNSRSTRFAKPSETKSDDIFATKRGADLLSHAPDSRAIEAHSLDKDGIFERLSTICYEVSKRFIDIFLSLTVLTFLFPIMVILSIIIRCSSPGPAIYCQRRLTDGDKTFTIFKFRTMSTDAERTSGAVWAADRDPRITPFGHFMRKTRLDELPQLLNVVIGDMSLVGPRPERPEFARELEQKLPSFSKRTQVKAGLTGLAQISSGYAASVDSYKEKLAWDRLYVQRRSFMLDLRIMIRTVAVVFRGDGAR
jgi:lipopolysaccharide/colanic/teichoic acid biosynthesis glycosyltransferase